MINKLELERCLNEFYESDREIIKSFFYYSDTKKQFAHANQLSQKYGIHKVLQGRCIKELNFNNLMMTKTIWLYNNLYRNYSYRFIIYLCEKELIRNCPLYHMLLIQDLLFLSKPFSPSSLDYFINLDEKYIELIKESDVLTWPYKQRSNMLFTHLDESKFKKYPSLFTELNDRIELFKYTDTNYAMKSKLVLLRTCLALIYELIEYGSCKIDSQFFLQIVKKSQHNSKLFEILSVFAQYHFFSESIINEVINLVLLHMNECQHITPASSIIKDILKSGKPQLWHRGPAIELMFYNCSDPYKSEILQQFSRKSTFMSNTYKFFLSNFDNSLSNPYKPLSFHTYLEQIKYFSMCKHDGIARYEEWIYTIIHSFYTFYQINYDSEVFAKYGYTTALLTEPNIAQYIAKGYQVINHNRLESVPTSDKWLFCYKDTNSSILTRITKIDLTKIDNPIFRNWYKKYLWYKNTKMIILLRSFTGFIDAFNYIQSLKSNENKSYFVTKRTPDNDISTQEMRAYLNHIYGYYPNGKTRQSYIARFRNILTFVSDNKLHSFEPGVFFELSRIATSLPKDNSKPISNDELQLIANKIQLLAKDNIKYKIYYLIFYIALTTEFRFSQICNLTLDCVKETAKQNEFIITSETKTSNQELVEQPITLYTKKCIDEVIELTRKYRTKNMYKDLNCLLFIVPGVKLGTYTKVNHIKFNQFLLRICSELSITPISVANLRDTFMTRAEEFVIKEHLSDIQFKNITSHSSTNTTITYYSRPRLIEMLELSNQVIIGNVDIQGNVVPSVSKQLNKKENVVSDNCGYCSADKCNVFSDLSCLLCKYFVTTISRKPYFEEQLRIIDKLLPTKKLLHDKEDLQNRKILILKYIHLIMELELGGENGK